MNKYVLNKIQVDFFNRIELTSFGGSWGLSLDDYYQKESLKPITKTPKGGIQPPFFLPVKKQPAINQLGYNTVMEKHTPHCKLSAIKTLVENGKVSSTVSALKGAAALGFDFADMLNVINALTPADFYKSMTTHADHRVWQDVYHANTESGAVYLKLTVIADVLIVSFKEL